MRRSARDHYLVSAQSSDGSFHYPALHKRDQNWCEGFPAVDNFSMDFLSTEQISAERFWKYLFALALCAFFGFPLVASAGAPDDQDATEQELVAKAHELGHSKKLADTHKLLDLLKNSSGTVRVVAAENLGELLADYGYRGNAVTSGGENVPEIAEGIAQYTKRLTLSPLEVAGFRSALITATKDTSAPVRVAAIRALERIFASDNPRIPPRAVKQAIAPRLKDADPRVILAAMRAACFLHVDESHADLLANLSHESANVRVGAAQALALIGLSEAAIPLTKLLKDREPLVRKSAAHELFVLCTSKSCDPAIGAALVEALPDKDLRSDIARAIVVMKIPEGREPLVSALQDDASWGLADFSDIEIKKVAEFLGLDVTAEIEMIVRQFSEGSTAVRARSASYLGSLHDRQAAPLLLEALKDTDSEVLSAIIRAVPEVAPEIGDKHALERLRLIASLPDARLVDTLQQQVPKLRDREMFGIAHGILRNQSLSTYGVCSLLPRMCEGRWEFTVHPNLFASRESLHAKLNWLKAGDSGTSRTIVGALVIAGAPEAVQPLSRLLKHAEVKVRADAGEALFWMCVQDVCDDAVVPSLLEALGDKATRGNAARTLAYLNKREAVEAVLVALEEDVAQDNMGLAEYWEADLKNLMDFVGKDNLRKLMTLYSTNGNAAARRKADQFLAEIGSA